MSKKLLSFFFSTILVFAFSKQALASSLPAPTVPDTVKATENFTVSFSLSLDPNYNYYAKVRLGTETSNLKYGQTYNSASDQWLTDSDAWTSFPVFTTNSAGTLSASLTAKTSSNVVLGSNLIRIAVRRTDTKTTLQSETANINVEAAPPNQDSDSDGNTGSTDPTPKLNLKLALSEFMPNPETGEKEWVEIRNLASSSADLYGWKIDDGPAGSSPLTLEENSTIAGFGYKVFYLPSKLNNSGDSLRLLKPDGSEADVVNFGETTKGVSFAKGSSGIWQQTLTPTPAAANIINTGEVLGSTDTSKSSLTENPKSDNYSLDVLTPLEATASSHSGKQASPVKNLFASESPKGFFWILVVIGGFLLVTSLTIFGIKSGFFRKIFSKNAKSS
ncbi:MAG: lamin tail domain-containing protein [bacterium]|nr:lamin tail domain-containing protein [bacterium]